VSGAARSRAALAALAIVASPAPFAQHAAAQEAANTPAATQPSPGSVVVRTTARVWVFDGGAPLVERDGLVYEERFRLAIGLTRELSAEVNVPLFQSDFDEPAPGRAPFDRTDFGFGDVDLSMKLRIWKEDLGPIDTMRVSLIAGTEIPTSTNDFGSHSFDPMVGAAFTGIFGRHGIGASIGWRFTTGSADDPLFAGDSTADVAMLQASHLYRLWPAEFPEEHVGAWYWSTELAATFETNGDAELTLSPGILYEGPRFAFELGLQVPLARDLEERPTTSLAAFAGLRFLF
jgi:hypothetical protein